MALWQVRVARVTALHSAAAAGSSSGGVALDDALDGTRQSALDLPILHLALFDHGYMFWEKRHKHEQMEQIIPNNTKLNFLNFQGTYPYLWYIEHEDFPSCSSVQLLNNNRDG